MDIEEQRRVLLTFATLNDVSQNDKALLLKAEYYLLRLSHVLYVNKIDSALFRIRVFRIRDPKTRFLSCTAREELSFFHTSHRCEVRKKHRIGSFSSSSKLRDRLKGSGICFYKEGYITDYFDLTEDTKDYLNWYKYHSMNPSMYRWIT